jgi:endonuclease/exonuclease/phosphatase family metal-dependent hydrolase
MAAWGKWLASLAVSTACLSGCGDPAVSAVDAGPQQASPADAAASPSDAGADTAVAVTPAVLPPPKPAGALSVLTYNVMCSFCMNKDHPQYEQAWSARVPWLRDVITRLDPDLLGLQELQAILPTASGKPEVVELLGDDTPYAWFYHTATPTDAVPNDYPDALVAWKKARFDKLDQGVLWLSPTPQVPFSTGLADGPQFPRVLVWVRLHDKLRDRDLWLAGTHFDNNYPSQEKSAPLALQALGPLTQQAPLLVTGDFNASPAAKAYALLAAGQAGVSPPWRDTFALAKSWSVVHNQATAPAYDPTARIDHVFVAGPPFAVTWWGIDLWQYGAQRQPPSDHDGAIVTHVDW